jgi:hypothetical protein
LTFWAGGPVSFLVTTLSEGPYNPGSWWFIIIPVLLTIALLAAARGGYRLALAAAISTVAVQHGMANGWNPCFWFSSVYRFKTRWFPSFGQRCWLRWRCCD